ncbi:hypothetical protein D3H55_21025 [Bacillus salacetis]|uniref:Uncharacterized protein n=1 Tax=Bacillus salacetis TaxID=2315464 RepID=A0A3A1QQ89_9BACI|nr:hypothetical protein D3H55_21025 [Bacillus salacetis]
MIHLCIFCPFFIIKGEEGVNQFCALGGGSVILTVVLPEPLAGAGDLSLSFESASVNVHHKFYNPALAEQAAGVIISIE